MSSQGRSLAEEQVIWQFFLKRKINKRHSNSPENISVKSNENNSTSKRYSNVFTVSASDELSQSRSQETNGQAKYEDGSGTALVFSLIQAIVIVSQHQIKVISCDKIPVTGSHCSAFRLEWVSPKTDMSKVLFPI